MIFNTISLHDHRFRFEIQIIPVQIKRELMELLHKLGGGSPQQYPVVIHDQHVINQTLHILYDMRSQKHRFVSRLSILPHMIHEQTTITGIQSQREVVQNQQVGILCQYQSQRHLRPLPA